MSSIPVLGPTVALTADAVASVQRRTRTVLMIGQVLAGLGMGATLSIGAILAAEISGSPAFSGMAATAVRNARDWIGRVIGRSSLRPARPKKRKLSPARAFG